MSDEERTPLLLHSPPTYGEVVTSSYSEAVPSKPIKPEVVVSEQPNHRLGQHPSESVVDMIYSQNNSSNDQTIIIDRHIETHEDRCDICCKNCRMIVYGCLCCLEMISRKNR